MRVVTDWAAERWRRFRRMLYYHLIIPILRARQETEVIARGVGVGLFFGMTPTVGAQMYLVILIWAILARGLRWHFSLVLAIAWSWLSNPLTMVPLYYVWFLTGSLLLHGSFGMESFAHFSEVLGSASADPDADIFTQSWDFFVHVWNHFGVTIIIGCLPYGVVLGIAGYFFTRWLLRRRHHERRARLAAVKATIETPNQDP